MGSSHAIFPLRGYKRVTTGTGNVRRWRIGMTGLLKFPALGLMVLTLGCGTKDPVPKGVHRPDGNLDDTSALDDTSGPEDTSSPADTADTADTAANAAARDKALLVPGRKMRGECNRFLHDSQLRRQV